MPIGALPQTTVRAIGSTSVISDPCAVVKELLDNALDASASSLQIEISQNTVDVIQLKDNGHGISTEDHPNVCKHAFTSKIETVDDLRNVGGTSFGFRGEALASVAEMSGAVTITTRTASEVTATSLIYGRDGELTGSTRTSHPVGTTVRISDFLKHIPVRRQTALKGATKTLATLKKLLHAYAFAQPSKRFSLKVLKAKNELNNWMYAPNAEATLKDATLKIVGRDVASSCILKETSSHCSDNYDSSDKSGYEFVAVLPREDIDIAKVNNMGQYVSVDGRPLSTNTGVGQDITKIFKSYIRAAVSKIETQSKVTDPFCYLQLKCPKGAYDVNIEPGKDDVLFSDRDLVISLIERLFTEHYGPLADGQKTSLTAQKAVSLSKPHGDGGFELLLSRRRSEEPSMQTLSVRNDSTDAMPANPISHRVPASSVSLSPESSHSHSTGNDSSTANGGSESRGSRYLNPWSISRINASFQTPQRPRAIHSSSQSTTTNSPEVTGRQGPSRHPGRRPSQDSPELPSPPVSSLTPGSPVSRRGPLQVSRGSPPEINQSVNSSRRAARERDRERYGNGALDTWFQRTTGAWLSQGPVEAPSGQEVNVPSLSQLAQQRFQPDPQGQAAGVRAETEAHEDSGGSMEDEIPPPSSRVEINIDSSHDERQEAMDSGRGFPVLEKWAASLHRDFDSANQTDLERTLDFERRKKEANQRQRTRSGACDAQLNPQNDPPAASSPHHNRYLSAKAILNAERPLVIEPDSRPALSPHDPRACLMRHQSDHQAGEASKNIGTVRRLHTSKLPFERVPEGQDLHDTCLPLSADLSLISTSFNLTAIHDSYTRRGTETDGFSVSDMESVVSSWNQHLAAIIQKQYKTKGQSTSPELQVDIAPVISRHAAQFNTS